MGAYSRSAKRQGVNEEGESVKRSKGPTFATDFPQELTYSLPKRGQQGLTSFNTRLNPLGNQYYDTTYDTGGGEKIVFSFPASRNRYVNFSNLRFCFDIQLTTPDTRQTRSMIADPVVGVHGLIRDTTFTTGAGETIERYEDYGVRVAEKMKFMNTAKSIKAVETHNEGITAGPTNANVTSYVPGTVRLMGERAYNSQGNLILSSMQHRGNGNAVSYAIPFRGSDFCMQPDVLIPLNVFNGLRLEITLENIKKAFYPVCGADSAHGRAWSNLDGATFRIGNIHLDIEYYAIPEADDNRLMQALDAGRVIPIQYTSARVLRGTHTLQNHTTTEVTIPINETLSSVRSIVTLFRNTNDVAHVKKSNYYFTEPGRSSNVANYTNENVPGTFRSFRVELDGATRPEFAITNRKELYRYLAEVAAMEGKVLGANSSTPDLDFASALSADAPFCGADFFGGDALIAANVLAEPTEAQVKYMNTGGMFALAFPLRTYRASKNVMNGVRFKNNFSIHTKFFHSGGPHNYERLIFLHHDTILEIGGKQKTIVKT